MHPRKAQAAGPPFISPAAIRSSVKAGVCLSLGSGMDACSRKNGAADFLFHSIVHLKSSRSLSESVFLAARSRDLTVGSGVFVICAISFAVNWWK